MSRPFDYLGAWLEDNRVKGRPLTLPGDGPPRAWRVTFEDRWQAQIELMARSRTELGARRAARYELERIFGLHEAQEWTCLGAVGTGDAVPMSGVE